MLAIGDAAKAAGLPVKTLRYYDEIGLVKPSDHSAKGYRLFGPREVRKLVFVRHARSFGFSIDDCRNLLSLYEDPRRTSKEVREIAVAHLAQIREKMSELQKLHDELSHLAQACHGDHRPDCPIIDFLAETEAPGTAG